LKRVDASHPLAQPLRQLEIVELPREVHKKGDHTGGYDARPLLGPALQGYDVGLVSEAGMPAVADPGSSVVRAARRPLLAGAGAGGEWPQWAELRIRRLPAAGRGAAVAAHPRARSAGGKD